MINKEPNNIKFRISFFFIKNLPFVDKNTFRVKSCSESIGATKVKLKGKLLAWVVRKFVNVDKWLKKKLRGKVCIYILS